MTFEQRPEGSEGANFVVSWKTLPKKGSGSWGKTSVAGVEWAGGREGAQGWRGGMAAHVGPCRSMSGSGL